jgi:hypothetical protein
MVVIMKICEQVHQQKKRRKNAAKTTSIVYFFFIASYGVFHCKRRTRMDSRIKVVLFASPPDNPFQCRPPLFSTSLYSLKKYFLLHESFITNESTCWCRTLMSCTDYCQWPYVMMMGKALITEFHSQKYECAWAWNIWDHFSCDRGE